MTREEQIRVVVEGLVALLAPPPQPPAPGPDRLLRVREVCERLGVEESFIYDLVRRRELAGIHLSGRCLRVTEASVATLIERGAVVRRRGRRSAA